MENRMFEKVRRDIVPEVAGLCGLGQQVSDQVAELLLRSGDVLTSMHECREFGAVVLVGSKLPRAEAPGLYSGATSPQATGIRVVWTAYWAPVRPKPDSDYISFGDDLEAFYPTEVSRSEPPMLSS